MLFLIFSSLTVSRFIVAESMEAEKKRSKGGFLNLFDWNGKSRKKLFANIPEELPGNFFFFNILFSRYHVSLPMLWNNFLVQQCV